MSPNAIAKAMSGNLTYDPNEEKPLDRLMALAMGSIGPGRESHLNSLGVSLVALKHARRGDYYLRAVRQLGDALAWRKIRDRGGVAKQAILEFCEDGCANCHGAKECVDGLGVTRACAVCSGTGRRRYGDEERKNIPGKAMSEAHRLMSLAVSIAVRGAMKRLT